MKKLKIFIVLAFIGTVFIPVSCKKEADNDPAKVTDIDGNVYNTVKIGTQVWMVENLNVTHFRNGDEIPLVTDSAIWSDLTNGAYCNYNNIPGNSVIYGKLYNWYTIEDSRLIAPKGWHLPSDEDWSVLVDHLGGDDVAGDKLKEINSIHWIDATANNESGFTALPGGHRNNCGAFDEVGDAGYWWSTTENSDLSAYGRGMYFYYSGVARGYRDKVVGFSVRCLKD